jgi:hypothetical protein
MARNIGSLGPRPNPWRTYPRCGRGNLMRRSWTGAAAALGCLLLAGTVAAASDEADQTDPLALREEAVALVLAQDSRFADVPDFERQAALATSNFDYDLLLGSDYYRVLPTLASVFSPWMYDLGYPANWLIEVTLVRGCTPLPTDEGPSSDTVPYLDPCEWRHSWFYRVEPDDTVTLLFEEGHPDPMPVG